MNILYMNSFVEENYKLKSRTDMMKGDKFPFRNKD